MEKIIGRTGEFKELQWALDSQRSEFVVIYGRRRVGKTFLIRKFFNDTYSFRYVGSHNQSKQIQLNNFREALIKYSGKDSIPALKNWHEAFYQLEKYLEECTDKRKVVFFDEMPWIDTHGSDFVAELEYFWSNWVQNRDDIMFIACGSATSWMKEKLEDNRGGLHNRITHKIYLRPFYLCECKEYLEEHGFGWDEYDIIQCYMIFGGVPYYLSLLRPYLSLNENVDSLIFRRGGDLSDEFKELYNALFNNAERYINVVKLLSTKREGFTRAEIEKSTKYGGGNLTKILDNLERCDFIISYSQFGNKKKQALYRLSDFYTLFYLKYVETNRSKDENYWQHHFTDRSVESWQGFTFEEICLQHLPQIKKGLGITGIGTEASSWRYIPAKDEEKRGFQIDLIIQREDNIIHLIECKFAGSQYVITKDYKEKLRERVSSFKEITATRKNAVITFITPFGVAQGVNSSIVHSQLTARHLFKSLDD